MIVVESFLPMLVSVAFAAAVYALVAQSIQLTIGHTGMFDLGQLGSMLVAGYAMAVLTLELGLSLTVSAIAGFAVAALVGGLLSTALANLDGDYFALATLAFAEILRVAAANLNGVTNGTQGLISYDSQWRDSLRNWRDSSAQLAELPQQTVITVLAWLTVVALALLSTRLQKSPWGTILAAIRDDDIAVRTVGKNVRTYRVQTYMIAIVPLAFAAILIALDQAFLTPTTFGLDLVVVGLVVAIGAGMSPGWRLLVAATAYAALLELTRTTELGMDSAQAATARFLLVGVLLIVAIRVRARLAARSRVAEKESV